MDIDKALKEGAYTCQFSYNDDEASCFGVGIQYFEQFNAIWESSAHGSPRKQFAELIYIDYFRHSYSSWNLKTGSQGNYTLQLKGLFPSNIYQNIPSTLRKELENIAKTTTWGSSAKKQQEQEPLYELFWPEHLLGEQIVGKYSEELSKLDQYTAIITNALGNQDNWKSNMLQITDISKITQDMWKNINKSKMAKVIASELKQQIRKKCKKLNPVLKHINLTLSTPDDNKLINMAKQILDGIIESRSISINNSMHVEVINIPRPGQKPSWYPTELSLPSFDATDTVKIHCASRALLEWSTESYWKTVDTYSKIFGYTIARSFLGQVKKLHKINSLEVIREYRRPDGTEWVDFGREGILNSWNNIKRLFTAPITLKEFILKADQIHNATDLRIY